MSILPDDSILASGENPAKDRYHVDLTLGTAVDLAAVRLEALTDDSLPANGPGRYPGKPVTGQFKGTFGQISWKVTAALPDREDPITLTFDHAWADRQMKAYPIKVDGHWNIAGEGEGRDCTAIWTMSKPVPLPAGTTLTFEMQCHDDENGKLGHFRLSVSGDPAAIDREQKNFAARKLTDPGKSWRRRISSRASRIRLTNWSRGVPSWPARSATCSSKGRTRTRTGNARWRSTAWGLPKRRPTSNCSRSGPAPLRPSRIGIPPRRTGRGPRAGGTETAPKLLADFARRLAANGQVSRAKVPYDKSQALLRKLARSGP